MDRTQSNHRIMVVIGIITIFITIPGMVVAILYLRNYDVRDAPPTNIVNGIYEGTSENGTYLDNSNDESLLPTPSPDPTPTPSPDPTPTPPPDPTLISDGSTLRIPLMFVNSFIVELSTPTEITGNITQSNLLDERTFTPALDGNYRLEMHGLIRGRLNVAVVDSAGFQLASQILANGNGINVNLVAGMTYTIRISYHSSWPAISPYTLSIWHQKPPVDISNYTETNNSIQFIGQANNYVFTAHTDGSYRFEIAGLIRGRVAFTIWNSAGFQLASRDLSNGNGVSVTLVAGETYTIRVNYHSSWPAISPYTLSIWHQKPTVDISGYLNIVDSMQFVNQVNNYVLTSPRAGDYRFEISGLINGRVTISILNSAGFQLASRDLSNGDGVNVTLTANATYTIRVSYHSSWPAISPYTLNIIYP